MSILVGPHTRLVVQGITGREGDFHSRAMQAYGTPIVAGVTPGKGGQSALDGTVPSRACWPPLPGVTPATTSVP